MLHVPHNVRLAPDFLYVLQTEWRYRVIKQIILGEMNGVGIKQIIKFLIEEWLNLGFHAAIKAFSKVEFETIAIEGEQVGGVVYEEDSAEWANPLVLF